MTYPGVAVPAHMAAHHVVVLLRAALPLTRDGAQQDARDELRKAVYRKAQPSWTVRILTWLLARLNDVWRALTSSVPGGGLGVLAIVALVVAVGVGLRVWLGPVRRSSRSGPDGGSLDSPLTAALLRTEAEALAGRGAWAPAVRSRMRAIVRSLEERALCDPRPGRTVTEVWAVVAELLPAAEPEFGRAADAFAEIWYGGREANEADYRTVVDADTALTASRPAPTLVPS